MVHKYLEILLRLFWVCTQQWNCWIKHLNFLLQSVTFLSGNRLLQNVGDTDRTPLRPPSPGPRGRKLLPLGLSRRSPPTPMSGFHLCPRDVRSRKSPSGDTPASPRGGVRRTQSHCERALLLPALHSPRHWLKHLLSAFCPSLFWAGGGWQGRRSV